jgi:hypothetical protein
VELTPENGPQSLSGRTALLTAVLSDGEFSKSNMSSSVSAKLAAVRQVRVIVVVAGKWRERHHEALSISASTKV